jgi:hypothetical protein
MKKYYGHTLLYLHETILLGSAQSDGFTEVFTDTYQPMMTELGARLFAIWESTPYNGDWPQVTIIWEIDGFSDYARIGAAQARGGSHEAAAGKWSAFLADIGASGEGRIMYPGPSNKTLAQLREANFTAPLVIQEIMQTKPGRRPRAAKRIKWSTTRFDHLCGDRSLSRRSGRLCATTASRRSLHRAARVSADLPRVRLAAAGLVYLRAVVRAAG